MTLADGKEIVTPYTDRDLECASMCGFEIESADTERNVVRLVLAGSLILYLCSYEKDYHNRPTANQGRNQCA